jgi:hypothetical protein
MNMGTGEKGHWRNNLEEVSPLAVKEIVRFVSPVTFMRRTATRETKLAGTKPGTGLMCLVLESHRYGAHDQDPSSVSNNDAAQVSGPESGLGRNPKLSLSKERSLSEII